MRPGFPCVLSQLCSPAPGGEHPTPFLGVSTSTHCCFARPARPRGPHPNRLPGWRIEGPVRGSPAPACFPAGRLSPWTRLSQPALPPGGTTAWEASSRDSTASRGWGGLQGLPPSPAHPLQPGFPAPGLLVLTVHPARALRSDGSSATLPHTDGCEPPNPPSPSAVGPQAETSGPCGPPTPCPLPAPAAAPGPDHFRRPSSPLPWGATVGAQHTPAPRLLPPMAPATKSMDGTGVGEALGSACLPAVVPPPGWPQQQLVSSRATLNTGAGGGTGRRSPLTSGVEGRGRGVNAQTQAPGSWTPSHPPPPRRPLSQCPWDPGIRKCVRGHRLAVHTACGAGPQARSKHLWGRPPPGPGSGLCGVLRPPLGSSCPGPLEAPSSFPQQTPCDLGGAEAAVRWLRARPVLRGLQLAGGSGGEHGQFARAPPCPTACKHRSQPSVCSMPFPLPQSHGPTPSLCTPSVCCSPGPAGPVSARSPAPSTDQGSLSKGPTARDQRPGLLTGPLTKARAFGRGRGPHKRQLPPAGSLQPS